MASSVSEDEATQQSSVVWSGRRMYCWGSTVHGELGVGAPEVEQLPLPTFMDFTDSWNIVQGQITCSLTTLSSGLSHSLLLSEEGQVYSCGNNELGQLGHSKITRIPEKIDALENYTIAQIAAGDQHSLALTNWGLIYAWGENGYGQLGINSSEEVVSTPHLIKSLARKQVVQVAGGANHTLALTLDGEVYSWGQNNLGQLGMRQHSSQQREPVLVSALLGTPVVLVAAGGHHSAALSQAGFLATWGSNKYGQLGYKTDNDTNCSTAPALVPNLATYSDPVVYVALGESHTAALDAHGKLWTFGHGRYGQLGHGSSDDISVPRTCLDLVGSKVTQAACGRCHTLVFLPSQGQVYAFGQGMSGQLGIKTPHNCNLPQVVVGPWVSPRGISLMQGTSDTVPKIYVQKIFAGGDVSMARVSKQPNTASNFLNTIPCTQPTFIMKERVNEMVSIEDDDMIDDELFTYIETVFGSMSCWNRSFLIGEGADKHSHGLDYRLAEEYTAKLGRVHRESIKEMVYSSVMSVVKQLSTPLLSIESLRCFVLLPLLAYFLDSTNMKDIQLPYAEALLGLEKHKAAVFKLWMKALPLDFTSRLLTIYKSVIIHILNNAQHSQTDVDRRVLLSALKVLNQLHEGNFQQGSRVARLAYEEFYIPEIAEKIDIRSDYLNWINSRIRHVDRSESPISFCEYPFLFDAQAKTLLLRCDATRQMQGAIQEAVINSNPMLWLFDPAQIQFLNINIHRNNIVDDTIQQLLHHGVTDYKRPLKVHFIGEEAEDAGGVRKEFFLLLLREILNPDYGMFTQYPETNNIWFKEGTLEAAATYSLIGIVCGLAIYNFTIINLPFPLALYKKLLGQSVGLDDLADFDPHLTRNLHELLEYEGNDVEEVFCLNFTVTQQFYDVTNSIPLKPGGDDIPVTTQNKQEYVDLLVDYKLTSSIAKQYQAFHDGFYRVCGGGILKLFQPMELMALVTGNENFNWAELEQNTEYKGEYHREHEVIKMFWEVFHGLSTDQKKQFLIFLTGTDRIPILGMKAVKMIIQSTNDDSFLPVAHTCISQLDLPVYSTKEKLRYKLLQAIQQSEGFGLV
ncbi:hypothetical protein Pcinc_023478 [Petrolisthes cinctipes]|uniref:HECT domain-containing protein n=1 Tax=Petrolisthes cinctipes TaxID=88211 RepID=A0AAE1FCX4_PETCI|nr:hypothetical protein Pcinc_023478 [Petrolisthes cinctipes]